MKNFTFTIALLYIINLGFSQTGKIDANNINVTVNPSNVMFQTLAPDTNTYFEALKGSGMSTIFSSSFWMAGIRNSDTNLMGSFQNFISPHDTNNFTTGPLTVTVGSATNPNQKDFGAALTDSITQAKWDKVFCINKWEIEIFVRWFLCNQDPSCDASVSFPGYMIPNSITNWPAHGDVSLFQDFYMAPFYDNDGDGNYNPSNGDYPCIKGDKYCWFVVNDKGPSDNSNMGIEIHTEVYSFNRDSLNPLSNTIFVGRDIINRSTSTYNDFIVSQFTDFDIGCWSDDFNGSMPSVNSYYAYNADNIDDNCSGYSIPYGLNPPAQGVTFLNKTINASVYSGSYIGTMNINIAYNSMNGKFPDGSPIYYGHPSSIPPVPTNITTFMFPYLPPPGKAPWTEITAGNPAGERRMLGSISPITLTPGKVHEVDIAYVFSRSDSGHLKSVDKLYQDIQTVQSFYNDSIPSSCTAFVLSEKELTLNTNDINLFPNPVNSFITLENKSNKDLKADIITIEGKIVVSQFDINTNNKINISQLTDGMYLVRVTNSKNQVIIKKLIKN